MKNLTKVLSSIFMTAAMMAVFISFGMAQQTVLVDESFELASGTTPPAGWVIEQVTGTLPGISFVSSSTNPTITSAYDGTKFTSYNSFNIPTGSTRLKKTASVSTINHSFVMVDFAWYEDAANAAASDKIDVQWSINGTTWNTVGSFNRYNATEGWKLKNVVLPGGAENQANLYIAFLFTSANGNNCALDFIRVTEGPPQPPSYVEIGTGTLSSNYPYTTFWKGGRTQMLFSAAELVAAGATAGDLSSVAFNVISYSPQVMNGFNIKLGATSLTTLSAGYVNGLATYYNTPYAVPGTGWRTIVLSTPYVWNGTSNVLVEICYANSSSSNYSPVYSSNKPGMTAGHFAESLTECSTSTNSAPPYRPNIRIGLPPINMGAIRGYIRDALTLAPVAGAIVALGSKRDTSKANGSYIFYNVAPGLVNVNASATGYYAGTANSTIVAGSVTNLNILLTPGPRVSGTVTDISTGAPLTGATVTIGTGASAKTTMTVAGGTYITPPLSISGAQPIVIGKTGYDNFAGTVSLVPNTITTADATLYPTVVQPGAVTAALNDPVAATAVNINWQSPMGYYQLIYDDGGQENFSIWAAENNLNALKFTPLTWPVKLTGGYLNLGTPANYSIYYLPLSPFKMLAYKADGPGGSPETILDSVTVQPTGTGWIYFSFSSPITLNSGDFYLAMKQGGSAPHAAGLAVDTNASQSRSYSRDAASGGSWSPATGNFMIRASVQGAGGPLLNDHPTGGDQPLGISYQVYRLMQGQEGNMALWTSIWTGASTNTTDIQWPSLPDAPYRWAVRSVYSPPGQRYSSPVFSNIIGKNWTANVDVCVTLSCAANQKAGTVVSLTNASYPDTNYSKTTDTSGCVHFTNVWKGTYELRVLRFTYPAYTQIVTISGNTTFNVLLLQQTTPPGNLTVNSLNLQASWTSPVTTTYLINENWTSGSFSTNQWTISGGTNWQISGTNGNPSPAAIFNWTPSAINYDQYLTSKSFSGVHAQVMRLQYDIFLFNYSTDFLNTMQVELWNGSTWTVLRSYDNIYGSFPWTTETIDISSVTDNPAFKIRFHASGTNSYYINNWAVDNIKIINTLGAYGSDPCVTGYDFYLDNTLLGFTTDTTYSIPPGLVVYGQTYTACVRAQFGVVSSTQACVNFTSNFLYPPLNLTAGYIPETTTLNWNPPSVINGLTGYNVYRNSDLVNMLPSSQLTYTETPSPYGLNSYTVTAVYGPAESLPAGPVVINAVPFLHSVTDIIVYNGMTTCYNAMQTLTIAGNGTSFTVENGGSATMISGQNILYLPGTLVEQGGYMWGYIAPAGPFCTYPSMPVMAGIQENPDKGRVELSFKIYPNPTSGNIVLEIMKETSKEQIVAEVYGITGNRVITKTLHGEHNCVISLSDKPAGIYIIRVIMGDKVETARIVRY
jgi:hypothetical protein